MSRVLIQNPEFTYEEAIEEWEKLTALGYIVEKYNVDGQSKWGLNVMGRKIED